MALTAVIEGARNTPDPDWEAVRQEMRSVFEQTRENIVEVIMKDNHTLGNTPENVVTWCRIAQEEAQRHSKRYP